MSAEIADAAERRAALDPARSFIVQAPAGSGKTELLTRRLLVLLALVDEPEEVVAMTFTRKAAAEMRHRVFAAIRDAQAGHEPASDYARETIRLAHAVLDRSRTRGWQLEDSPQRLRILTIDALCMQITQQSPLTAGFGGRVNITELAEPLYRDAARGVIEGIEAQPDGPVARVLRHFDNRVDVLEQQLVRLLSKRDQWLRLVTREQREHRSREVLEQTFAWMISEALRRVIGVLPQALARAWTESAIYAARNLGESDPGHALTAIRDFGWPDETPASLPVWQALVDLVLTADGSWRQRLTVKEGFPAGNGKAGKEEAAAHKDRHRDLIAALQDSPQLHDSLKALRVLPDPRFDDAQWAVLDALLDTLLLAAGHLSLVFADRGLVDFAEVAGRAVVALGNPEAPSDLALRFDYRIRHLLVDEFQDTSTSQWDLLERLTAGWSEGDGHSLFVVGDPMQSIYRFREADVGLYLRAWRDGIGGLRLHPLGLHCNFRSDAGVVAWVNTAFATVLPAHADLNRSAVPYSPARATRPAGEGDAVRIHALVDSGDTEEAARVVEMVREAQAERPQGSVAILVRSRGHLAHIVPALRAAGVALRAVDIEGLAERPVIEDLRALTWALLHPMERTAWLAVLRAPWCGLSLGDLLVLSGSLPAWQSLWSAVQDESRWQQLSDDGRSRLTPVRTVLARSLSQRGRLPVRQWVESTWLAVGGPACADGPTALADAAVYFECLQRVARGAVLDDLEQLDLALAQLKATSESGVETAVNLMTIHKSKGLEFDTVIVPGLARGTRSDESPPVAWSHLPDIEGQARLLLAPVHATGGDPGNSFAYVRELEKEKQRLEDARLLYVAATRARHRLHLLGSVHRKADGELREPTAGSLLARLWPAVAAQYVMTAPVQARLDVEPVQDASDATLKLPPLRRLVDWQAPVLPAGLDGETPTPSAVGEMPRFEWAGELARCVGVVYHRWVQRIAADGVERWDARRCTEMGDAIREDLHREGVPPDQRAEGAERVMQALVNTLADPRGRWLLDDRHEAAASELALTAMLGGQPRRLVIDRCFVDEGTRWIIDFKTSVHGGGDLATFLQQERDRYRTQLQTYSAAMRRVDARPVRAALYLPLLQPVEARWIEMEL